MNGLVTFEIRTPRITFDVLPTPTLEFTIQAAFVEGVGKDYTGPYEVTPATLQKHPPSHKRHDAEGGYYRVKSTAIRSRQYGWRNDFNFRRRIICLFNPK